MTDEEKEEVAKEVSEPVVLVLANDEDEDVARVLPASDSVVVVVANDDDEVLAKVLSDTDSRVVDGKDEDKVFDKGYFERQVEAQF